MTDLSQLKLAVAIPSHGGARFNGVALGHLMRQVPQAIPIDGTSSLLCLNFNNCLCFALELHRRGSASHMLLLHDDVIPEGADWFGRFWDEYVSSNAQLLSAVIAVKSGEGFTSTARPRPGGGRAQRFTFKELALMPKTFTHPEILLNTGLMLFALDEPWLPGMFFHTRDSIVSTPKGLAAQCEGEDWLWSRESRERGCTRQFATRAISVGHVGMQVFPNNQVFGVEHDE